MKPRRSSWRRRLYDGDLEHARGKVLLAEDHPEQALEQLSAAFESVTDMGLRPLAVQVAVTAAASATAAGQVDVANNYQETARKLAEEIAGSVVDDELRAAVETAWLEPLDQLTTG